MHFDKKGQKLVRGAFRPLPDLDEVSVIRRDFVGDNFCKTIASEIELLARLRGNDRMCFRGFAVISAGSIRQLGSNVIDSRSEFLGHADIVHGYQPVKNEPFPSWLNDRLDQMTDMAKYVSDPRPGAFLWHGRPLA
jgi:hypothetical protein